MDLNSQTAPTLEITEKELSSESSEGVADGVDGEILFSDGHDQLSAALKSAQTSVNNLASPRSTLPMKKQVPALSFRKQITEVQRKGGLCELSPKNFQISTGQKRDNNV